MSYFRVIFSWLCRIIFQAVSTVTISNSVVFRGVALLYTCKGGRVIVGENSTIASGVIGNALSSGGMTVLRALTPGAEIHIGRNVGISNSVVVARCFISIGDGTLIGDGCLITDSDHHAVYPVDLAKRNKPSEITSRAVVIESGVFVGARAIILKGVRVGEGAVIGAGTVVTKNISPYSIVGGNPAAVLCHDWRLKREQ